MRLSTALAAELDAIIAAQGEKPNEHGLFFTDANGGILRFREPNFPCDRWRPMLPRGGLVDMDVNGRSRSWNGLTPHVLRHSRASLIASQHSELFAPTLQRFLGHDSVTFTLEKYGFHFSKGMLEPDGVRVGRSYWTATARAEHSRPADTGPTEAAGRPFPAICSFARFCPVVRVSAEELKSPWRRTRRPPVEPGTPRRLAEISSVDHCAARHVPTTSVARVPDRVESRSSAGPTRALSTPTTIRKGLDARDDLDHEVCSDR
jgi:hypothetical protein